MRELNSYSFNILQEINKIFNEILGEDSRFDFLILPIRRAYSLYKVWRNLEKTPPTSKVRVYTDVFLQSNVAVDVFKDAKLDAESKGNELRICIFDDAIRFKRNLSKLYNQLSALEVQAENITVYALAKYRNLKKPYEWSDINVCASVSLSELNVLADDVLNLLYTHNIPYAHCLPKSTLMPIETQRDADKYLGRLKSLGFIEKEPIKLQEAGCRYYIRYIDVKTILGDSYVNLVELAYIEAYFYSSNNPRFQLLPRVSLCPLTEAHLNQVWGILYSDLKNNPQISIFYEYIKNESTYVKYTLLEYMLSAVINCRCVYGTDKVDYDVDFTDVEKHFGEKCREILSAFNRFDLHSKPLPPLPADFHIPEFGLSNVNIEAGLTLTDFFSRISRQDDERCLSAELEGTEVPSLELYLVKDLICHNDGAYPYIESLVNGVAANKVYFINEHHITEIARVGEGASSQALCYSKFYFVINEVLASDPQKFSEWKNRGKLYKNAATQVVKVLRNDEANRFSWHLSGDTDNDFTEAKVMSLDVERRTVLALAENLLYDMYPDDKYEKFYDMLLLQ